MSALIEGQTAVMVRIDASAKVIPATVDQVPGDGSFWTAGGFRYWLDDEGSTWIRGHHASDSIDVDAMHAAYALRPEPPTVEFIGNVYSGRDPFEHER